MNFNCQNKSHTKKKKPEKNNTPENSLKRIINDIDINLNKLMKIQLIQYK